MTPEEKARAEIDAMLTASGWAVQMKDRINLSASCGVAVCELSFATGEPDYTLFVDGKAIGTTEAKPEGETLTSVEEQSANYVAGAPRGLAGADVQAFTGALLRDAPAPLIERELTGQQEWEDIEQRRILVAEIPKTTRQSLIRARIGQGLFKERVSQIEHVCRITFVNNPSR